MESKRNKPTNHMLAQTHCAGDSDYTALAQACIRACILRQKDVYYKLPYFAKVSADFPKGISVGKDGLCDVFKTKTVKLTNWLNSKGFLPEDHKNIMLSLRQMAYMEARINSLLKMDKISVDSGNEMWDNDVSVVEDNEEEEHGTN